MSKLCVCVCALVEAVASLCIGVLVEAVLWSTSPPADALVRRSALWHHDVLLLCDNSRRGDQDVCADFGGERPARVCRQGVHGPQLAADVRRDNGRLGARHRGGARLYHADGRAPRRPRAARHYAALCAVVLERADARARQAGQRARRLCSVARLGEFGRDQVGGRVGAHTRRRPCFLRQMCTTRSLTLHTAPRAKVVHRGVPRAWLAQQPHNFGARRASARRRARANASHGCSYRALSQLEFHAALGRL